VTEPPVLLRRADVGGDDHGAVGGHLQRGRCADALRDDHDRVADHAQVGAQAEEDDAVTGGVGQGGEVAVRCTDEVRDRSGRIGGGADGAGADIDGDQMGVAGEVQHVPDQENGSGRSAQG
jgi:hypothetical protein